MRIIPTLLFSLSFVLLSFFFAVLAVTAVDLFVVIPAVICAAGFLGMAPVVFLDSDFHI
jgi:hypothetical protein